MRITRFLVAAFVPLVFTAHVARATEVVSVIELETVLADKAEIAGTTYVEPGSVLIAGQLLPPGVPTKVALHEDRLISDLSIVTRTFLPLKMVLLPGTTLAKGSRIVSSSVLRVMVPHVPLPKVPPPPDPVIESLKLRVHDLEKSRMTKSESDDIHLRLDKLISSLKGKVDHSSLDDLVKKISSPKIDAALLDDLRLRLGKLEAQLKGKADKKLVEKLQKDIADHIWTKDEIDSFTRRFEEIEKRLKRALLPEAVQLIKEGFHELLKSKANVSSVEELLARLERAEDKLKLGPKINKDDSDLLMIKETATKIGGMLKRLEKLEEVGAAQVLLYTYWDCSRGRHIDRYYDPKSKSYKDYYR